MNSDKNFLYPRTGSTLKNTVLSGFNRLKLWVEDSLDQFRNDLSQLLYPIFVHVYLDLVAQEKLKEAQIFLEEHSAFFQYNKKYENFSEENESKENKGLNNKELLILESITSPLHLRENAMVLNYRSNKYKLSMGKYAFDLFINFLEENDLTFILKIVNQYLDIKISMSNSGFVGEFLGENGVDVDLRCSLATKEAEDAILRDEQYKFQHLESFVQQARKHREGKEISSEFVPSFSYIQAEVENLKDLSGRINLNEETLPSICCYTVHNCGNGNFLSAAEFSDDLKMLGCAFGEWIEVHSLTGENLRKIKNSNELGKADLKGDVKNLDENIFEEIGKSKKLVGHSGPVFSLSFFKGRKFLVSGSADRTVKLWSLDIFTVVGTFRAHTFPVWSVHVAPNNILIASGSGDRTANIWSVTHNTPVRLITSAMSDVSVVHFHPNGKYLFTGSSDHRIRMHTVEDGQLVRLFSGHTDTILTLSTSMCGKYLLSGSKDKTAIFWDIEKGTNNGTLKGHEGPVYSTAFSYLSKIIATASEDRSVRIWNRNDTKQPLKIFYTKNTPITKIKFGYKNVLAVVGAVDFS